MMSLDLHSCTIQWKTEWIVDLYGYCEIPTISHMDCDRLIKGCRRKFITEDAVCGIVFEGKGKSKVWKDAQEKVK